MINSSFISYTLHPGSSTAYRVSPPSSVCTAYTVPITSPEG